MYRVTRAFALAHRLWPDEAIEHHRDNILFALHCPTHLEAYPVILVDTSVECIRWQYHHKIGAVVDHIKELLVELSRTQLLHIEEHIVAYTLQACGNQIRHIV